MKSNKIYNICTQSFDAEFVYQNEIYVTQVINILINEPVTSVIVILLCIYFLHNLLCYVIITKVKIGSNFYVVHNQIFL